MTEPGEGRRERVARKLWDLYGGDIWPGIFHDADRRGEDAPGFDDLPKEMRIGFLTNAADLLAALEGAEPVAWEVRHGKYVELWTARRKDSAIRQVESLREAYPDDEVTLRPLGYLRHPPEHGTERREMSDKECAELRAFVLRQRARIQALTGLHRTDRQEPE